MAQDTNQIKMWWRSGVKHKVRGNASFQERALLRLKRIEGLMYPRKAVMDNWQIRQGYHKGIGDYKFLGPWKNIKIGDTWGGKDYTAFFKRRIKMPPEFKGEKVVLRMYLGGDALLSINGEPYQGLDPFRDETFLTNRARGDEVYNIEVEAYVAWHWEEYGLHTFVASELLTVDEELRQAYWDFETALKVLEIPNLKEDVKGFLEKNIWEHLKRIPLHDEPLEVLRKQILAAARDLKAGIHTEVLQPKGLMHLIGHSHLDLVFMWTYREFIRKIGRTHASMLRLMDQYPKFKFSQSQAKLYADMKRHFPKIFEQVKRRVKEGRWECLGAFWVEPDCNLISGESFVRQIIHGQRFFQEEFGVRSRICWQPDVFGCSWAMPQILAKSGIKYFLTNKMYIWNDTNPWVPNTFWWEGPEGSRVLSFVPPGHFIGTVDPDQIYGQYCNYSDKESLGEMLHIYGWGDGGGGVDPEMLESGQRYANFAGLMQTEFATAEEAFESIAEKAKKAKLPVFKDELYLEAHRGTFTNMALLKKTNRRLEILLRDAEALSCWAWLNGTRYPVVKLDAAWKDLLTTQFHDMLPGTYINEVHKEMLSDYARVETTGTDVREDSIAAILGRGKIAENARTAQAVAIINTLARERSGLVAMAKKDLAGKALASPDGEPLVQQAVTDLEGKEKVLAQVPQAPALGYATLKLAAAAPRRKASQELKATPNSLENEFLRVEFDKNCEISSIYDKENQREVLVKGQKGNRFQLFEDNPGKYEAWDIVATYRDHEINITGNATLKVDEQGPIRASLLLKKTFLKSSVRQRISLYAGSRMIHFETSIDWKERKRLLKVGFPVEITADCASYDIAYGNMTRANHSNNPYAAARFEVPAHQWMDMSQSDYGVSLLNDCKYGHEANGKLMRLSLLKGATFPNHKADIEVHHFTYVFYPHAGGWREAGTNEYAQDLNNPLLARFLAREPAEQQHSFMQLSTPKLTLEAIKQSEDHKDLVVRVTERYNSLVNATLTFDRPVKRAWACNLMEDNQKALKVSGNEVEFTATPFEAVTIRVAF